jgi:hypothetical protein
MPAQNSCVCVDGEGCVVQSPIYCARTAKVNHADMEEKISHWFKGRSSHSEGGIGVGIWVLLILAVRTHRSHCNFLFPPSKPAGYAGCRHFRGTFRLKQVTFATGNDPVTADCPPVNVAVRIVGIEGNRQLLLGNRTPSGYTFGLSMGFSALF